MKPAVKRIFFVIFCTFLATSIKAQTAEDSLITGLTKRDGATVISGYGEFKFNYDLRYETGTANMTRAVLFVGHRFNKRVSLISEFELEDAKIEDGEAGGEFTAFVPGRDMVYTHADTRAGAAKLGMPLPFTLRELAAIVSGLAPGKAALTWIVGKSTWGR